MLKVTFRSNVKDIIKSIETAQENIKQAKIDGMSKILNETFLRADDKYVIKGNYAKPTKSGKGLSYTSPPNADITVKRTTFFNPKTKFRKVELVALFVRGKITSRSGDYDKTLQKLGNTIFKLGSTIVEGVRVVLSENGLKVYADDKSKIAKLETTRQAGKAPVAPLTKTLKAVVKMWANIRLKLGK